MDVRCDRCQTEYELDETRLTDAGIAVKCTNCGNVFKVRRAGGAQTSPAAGGAAPEREWYVRRPDGTTLKLRGLTDLQKAVVERRVTAQDSISITRDSWQSLGSMPELASFFAVVQAANVQAASRQAAPAPALAPRASPMPAPMPAPDDEGPAWAPGPSAMGATKPAAAAEPAWATSRSSPQIDPELADALEREDLQSLGKSGGGLWVVLFLLLLCGGGAYAYYYFYMQKPGAWPFGPAAPVAAIPPAVPTAPPANLPAPEVAKPAPAVPAAVAAVPAKPASAPAEPPKPASPPPATVPAPVAAAAPPAPKPAEGKAAEASEGRGFDYDISQGHKLLDSKPSQALGLFEKASELRSASPEPDSGRGLAYANMERWSEAASAFETALRKSPEFTEAIMGLAEVYREQGHKQRALGLYQRYLDLTPDGPDAPAARAQLEQLKAELPHPAAPPPAQVPSQVIDTPAPAPEPAPQAEPPVAPAPSQPPPVVVPDEGK